MGNPAHTATQGVNLRIQGPKHPPKGLTCAVVGLTRAVKGPRQPPAGPTTPRVSVRPAARLLVVVFGDVDAGDAVEVCEGGHQE